MAWADIILDGRTLLHVFERSTMTGVRYRDEILEPYVHLFRAEFGPDNHAHEEWAPKINI